MAVRDTADPDPGFQLNEPTAVDLRAKTAGAWREFATTLAAVLSTLAPGAEVHLALDPAASGTGTAVYPVRIRVSEDGVVQAYAVGNAELPEGYRLDRSSVGDLIALGWSPPGVLPGSGNSFSLRSSQGNAKQLAMLVSRTLRDVCGVPHPAFLVYFAHDDAADPIETAPLGAARHRSAPDAVVSSLVADRTEERAPLAEQVRAVIAATLRISVDELSVDVDGDIGIRAGSAMLFIRVRENPPLIDVFSPVLTEVPPTERLYARLSELTNVMPIGRLYHVQDTVWASIPVFGRNFQAAHLMLAVQVMAGLADELDDRLQDEFGGSRFFGDPKPAGS
ncbi:hypothetical protein QQG74_15230 [Micromonospora sp. FIMYZ51]|uniref:T3SS (YopN, CesT) and YbjN peptide-binding chaperone 1 n=1 Tax=Micromonospora sp. FIMYZ51 TaxID=3051832 RepID=UPI00311D70E6